MSVKRNWQPIATAPRDRGIVARKGGGRARFSYYGKTSHVPLYGWNYLKHRGDVESAELWHPDEWDAASIARR